MRGSLVVKFQLTLIYYGRYSLKLWTESSVHKEIFALTFKNKYFLEWTSPSVNKSIIFQIANNAALGVV